MKGVWQKNFNNSVAEETSMQPNSPHLHLYLYMRHLLYPSLLLMLSFSACKSKAQKEEPCMGNPDPERMCPMIFQPVCGCDGITYSNSCVAGAAGVLHFSEGECNVSSNQKP
jgi:hypothetical protein